MELTVGKSNEESRSIWVVKQLESLPNGWKILDAGAGEKPYKSYCAHLEYTSHDFNKYDGKGDDRALQMQQWAYGKTDIVSDITSIPVANESFDAVLCTEVLEHVPDPVSALKELARITKIGGRMILTAPFCSLTHFSPYHFSTGFNRYFYEHWLMEFGFKILEIEASGNYFEYLAQELRRLPGIAEKYATKMLDGRDKGKIKKVLEQLQELTKKDKRSAELLCYGYHVLAEKE